MFGENPYQSFWDWVHGRWTCPKCGETWRSYGKPYFSDCTCVAYKDGELIEKRIECLECGVIQRIE